MLLVHAATAGESQPLAPTSKHPSARPSAPPPSHLYLTLLLVLIAVALASALIFAPHLFSHFLHSPSSSSSPPASIIPPSTTTKTTTLSSASIIPPSQLVSQRHDSQRFFFSSEPDCSTRDPAQTFTIGACGEKCGSSISVSGYFDCKKFVDRGCHFYSCKKSWGRRCTFYAPKLSPPELCPGDRLLIQSVEFSALKAVKFSVTLTPPTNSLTSQVTHAFSSTDIVFVLSATASMTTAVTQLRKDAMALAITFSTAAGPNVAMGLVIFRDEYYAPTAVQTLRKITTHRESVARAFQDVVPIGGEARAEANLQALQSVATNNRLGWRDGARKIIVLIGDEPGHEPSCMKGDAVTRQSISKALVEKGIEMFAVNLAVLDGVPRGFGCSHQKDGGVLEGGQTSMIAKESGGKVIVQRDQLLVTKALKEIADMLRFNGGVNVRDFRCKGLLDMRYEPGMPARNVGKSLTVTVGVTAKRKLCLLGGMFRCQLEFMSGAATIGKVGLDVNNMLGCM